MASVVPVDTIIVNFFNIMIVIIGTRRFRGAALRILRRSLPTQIILTELILVTQADVVQLCYDAHLLKIFGTLYTTYIPFHHIRYHFLLPLFFLLGLLFLLIFCHGGGTCIRWLSTIVV